MLERDYGVTEAMKEKNKSQALRPAVTNDTVDHGTVNGVEIDEKLSMNSNRDQALDVFAGRPEALIYSSQEANRVRWKLDLILLPMARLPPLPMGNKLLIE